MGVHQESMFDVGHDVVDKMVLDPRRKGCIGRN